jgi:hypothetical protein
MYEERRSARSTFIIESLFCRVATVGTNQTTPSDCDRTRRQIYRCANYHCYIYLLGCMDVRRSLEWTLGVLIMNQDKITFTATRVDTEMNVHKI